MTYTTVSGAGLMDPSLTFYTSAIAIDYNVHRLDHITVQDNLADGVLVEQILILHHHHQHHENLYCVVPASYSTGNINVTGGYYRPVLRPSGLGAGNNCSNSLQSPCHRNTIIRE